MSNPHHDCFGDPSFNPRPSEGTPMLLEARRDGEWSPIRIVRGFLDARTALVALPMFARQQKVDLVDVRVKALRTEGKVAAAERAVHAYNARTGSDG